MNIKCKKIYLFVLGLLFFCIVFKTNYAFGATNGYSIKQYNVDINVNENNSFDITETITTNFIEEKHGIIRKIPTLNYVVRNDGSKTRNIAFIRKIEVNDIYKKSSENGYICLKIGNSSKTLIGNHTYTIKYRYYIWGNDRLNNADELYFNIIGTEWDTDIENATFKITMPKSFDSSFLGFSSGYKGSKDSSNVQYIVNGNIITGKIKSALKPNQGITIRLTLPEGYFLNIMTKVKSICAFIEKQYMNIVLCIGVIFVLRAFLLWVKYGKDEKSIETVEFYPPQGYNSAEIGYMYYGKATDEAVISILIQLANKGYIKIEEIEKKGVLKKKTFKITKLKSYTGNDYLEKTFYNGLFRKGEPDSDELNRYIKELEQKGERITKYKLKLLKKRLPIRVVTENDLKNRFYITINSIKKHLEYDQHSIYEKNDTRQYKIKSMINKLSFLALFNIFVQLELNVLYKFLVVVILQFCITKLINKIFFYRRKTVVELISFIILTGITFYLTKEYIYPTILQNIIVRTFYIITSLQILILAVLAILMKKLTNYGAVISGQIKGFKRFLENAEKGQLETLVEDNPEYFYDILPYTYALGISKKWINQFETIAIRPPEWYDFSNSTFNPNKFTHFLDNTIQDVSNSMTYGIKKYNNPKPQNAFLKFLLSGNDNSGSSSNSGNSSSSSGGGSSGGGSGGRRRKFVVENDNNSKFPLEIITK